MLKIKVLSKKVITTDSKGKENVFYRYFSPVRIQCFDENGKDLGILEKSISVHFTKTASKKLKDDKVFAIIGAEKGENIQLPFVWKVTKDEPGRLRAVLPWSASTSAAICP